MGWRNPFRIEIDPDTDDIWVADYSPDARTANPDRGPAGHGKWAVVDEPSNYGWPYCATAELPYNDFDFATRTSGPKFNCDAPVNDSIHNTGLRELPPVEQPEVWYSYGLSSEFPELETGGIGPMAGPAYQFDKKATKGRNPVAWPKRYDDTPLFYEWTRDYIKGFHLDDGDDRRDRGRRPRHRHRQPDGHGVRPRRRALRAGVRRRLLRGEPRRAALPDRLRRRGRQPQPGPGDRGRADGRQGAR